LKVGREDLREASKVKLLEVVLEVRLNEERRKAGAKRQQHTAHRYN